MKAPFPKQFLLPIDGEGFARRYKLSMFRFLNAVKTTETMMVFPP